MPQLASTPKFVLLHHALIESAGAADGSLTKQVTDKVIAAVKHGSLAHKFEVTDAIVRLVPNGVGAFFIRLEGEVRNLLFYFWDRLEPGFSWMSWYSPPTKDGEYFIERGLRVLVDLDGVRALIRRLLTAAKVPAKRKGPGRPTVIPDEECDKFVAAM